MIERLRPYFTIRRSTSSEQPVPNAVHEADAQEDAQEDEPSKVRHA
jgi:hypothetical protein